MVVGVPPRGFQEHGGIPVGHDLDFGRVRDARIHFDPHAHVRQRGTDADELKLVVVFHHPARFDQPSHRYERLSPRLGEVGISVDREPAGLKSNPPAPQAAFAHRVHTVVDGHLQRGLASQSPQPGVGVRADGGNDRRGPGMGSF